MADLKSVTVEYLRELARKHLGRGHSKLKTKKELMEALVKLVPGLAKLAGVEKPPKEKKAKPAGKQPKVKGSRKAPVAVSASSRSEKPEAEQQPKKPGPTDRPLPGHDDEKTPVYHPPRPAEVVNFPPKPKPSRFSRDEETTLTSPEAPSEPVQAEPAPAEQPVQAAPLPATPVPVAPAPAPSVSQPVQHSAEPLVEGFFVARMAGEGEVFRHHLTESQQRRPREALGSPDHDEALGELPLDYGDDTALLLPRDPHTLFVLWDFSDAVRAKALDGLESPRAILRVYDGESLVRTIDFALESRSYYVHGLPPGRAYRVEAHFVGRDGRSRRIGPSSNRTVLPPAGPSSDTSVRFLRMPPVAVRANVMAKVAASAHTRTADIEEREYITWRRVALPGSGGFEDIPESTRERVIPGGAPGEGASSELPFLEVRRAVGSSEQLAWARPLGGSSEHWAGARPPGGASEYWAGARPPGGASEHWAGARPQGGASEHWAGAHPQGGASEHWAWSYSKGGASETWLWSHSGGGSSDSRVWATSPSGQGR